MILKSQVTIGPKKVIRFGFLRKNFSAIWSMYLRPPAASKIAAQHTTAMMISITCTGGEAGGILKMNTSIKRPIPDITPNPIPPYLLPI